MTIFCIPGLTRLPHTIRGGVVGAILLLFTLPLVVSGQNTNNQSQRGYTPPNRSSSDNSRRTTTQPSRSSSSSSSSRDSSRESTSRSSSRDSSRSSRSSRNSKTTAKPATPTAKPGQATVARTSASRSGGQSRVIKSSASKSKSTLSEFHLKVDNSAMVVYLDPPDATVGKNATFKTRFMISNPSAKRFDRVRFALRYDRDVVRPKLYTDKAIKSHLAAPSRLEVDPRVGVLTYSADLASPMSPVADTLLTIEWEAIQLTNRARFEFVRYENQSTGLWEGKNDVLGDEGASGDGFINASVQVVPPDLFERMKSASARRASGAFVEEIDLFQTAAKRGGVRLQLQGPNHPVQIGDTFTVDVVLDNSADSLLDRIDVHLDYDPTVLEVLDSDRDNWMTRGVNILDGPYHSRFPFDYHIDNSVYSGRGEIIYRVGITDPERLRHRVGTMATVTFRATKPSPNTRIGFRVNEQNFGPGTRIKYLDESVLGDAKLKNLGMQDLRLRVYN